jgi:hypothetical protein
MGKAAIIIVLGFAVSLGILSRAITGRLSEAVSTSAEYFDKTRAKNIASSAAEIYLRKLQATTATLGSYWEPSIMGGQATVTITSIDISSSAIPDTLQITTVASYQSINDTIINTVENNLAPGVTFGGAYEISNGTKAKFTFTGHDTITGQDYGMNGLPSNGCSPVNGMTYGDSIPTFNTLDSGTVKITGSGATPDTQRIGGQSDYTALALQLEGQRDTLITSNASKALTLGDTLHPKITLIRPVNKDITLSANGSTGAGILIIDNSQHGSVTLSGSLKFTGLVFVIGDSLGADYVSWNNNVNTPIIGAVIACGKNPWIKDNNQTKVEYSCDAIKMALGVADLPGHYIVDDWWE